MFIITKNPDGTYSWDLKIEGIQTSGVGSEEATVEEMKKFLGELGKHAFRNDFGGIEVKYELVESKESGPKPEENPEENTGGDENPDPNAGKEPETKQPDAGTQNPDPSPVPPRDGASAENIGTGPASSVD